MKWIFKSAQWGKPVDASKVAEEMNKVKDSITAAGRQYIAYSVQLGSLNPEGQRIEEHAMVIEETGDARIV